MVYEYTYLTLLLVLLSCVAAIQIRDIIVFPHIASPCLLTETVSCPTAMVCYVDVAVLL